MVKMENGTSGLRRRCSLTANPVSGTAATASTTAETGMLTKSTHRQPGSCDSSPPSSTPNTDASGIVPLQAPIALIRSLPSRTMW